MSIVAGHYQGQSAVSGRPDSKRIRQIESGVLSATTSRLSPALATAATATALVCIVDLQLPSLELVSVQLTDGRVGVFAAAHLDESEPSELSCVTVGDQMDLLDLSLVLFEERT